MPSTNLFGDLELDRTMDVGPGGLGSSGLVDNERNAYKLAFELSLLGLSSDTGYGSNVEQDSPGPMSFMNNPLSGVGLGDEVRSKKSQNMTECVPVPSSEHVAEIVGRQGCKIKALRAKTNTYIKTPVRGEEPVFVVTGRKEDVGKAKREILSAAEHFSQIRASRKNNLAAVTSGASTPPGPPTNIPGQITIQVRVPYRVVGLVVGPKGATIKRIQHQTHTYIVTPSRDKEPVFEVSGLPESVESAKREIESHIALRTGNGTSINGLGNGLDHLIDDPNIFMQICKNNNGYSLSNIFNNLDLNDQMNQNLTSSTGSLSGSGSCSSSSSITGGRDITNIWGSADEGLGDSPSFESSQLPNIWSYQATQPARPSPADSTSPVDSLLSSSGLNNHEMQQHTNNTSNTVVDAKCRICAESKVTHAFLPCGHNLVCRECAIRVCDSTEPFCPYCSMPARQSVHIKTPSS